MELALVVSVLSLCGFAAALSYNIYEFRRISKEFREGMEGIREGMKGMIREMQKGFERAERDHRAIVEVLGKFGGHKSKLKKSKVI